MSIAGRAVLALVLAIGASGAILSGGGLLSMPFFADDAQIENADVTTEKADSIDMDLQKSNKSKEANPQADTRKSDYNGKARSKRAKGIMLSAKTGNYNQSKTTLIVQQRASDSGRSELMVKAIISAIILAMSLPFFSVAASSSINEDAVFARVFNDSLRRVTIENLDGATEVQTWTAPKLSVTASRATSGAGRRVESEISFEQPAPDSLRIITKPDSRTSPINLIVYVPASVQLSVKGGGERIIIKGLTASLSVETGSGSVALHLPKESNTDLSLRAIAGAIESRLPVTIFGQADAHLLDGRLGQGGAPVIARSQRGQINLLPDDEARLIALNKVAGELPPAGSESNLVSHNLMSRTEQNFDEKMPVKEERIADTNTNPFGRAQRQAFNQTCKPQRKSHRQFWQAVAAAQQDRLSNIGRKRATRHLAFRAGHSAAQHRPASGFERQHRRQDEDHEEGGKEVR